MQALNVHQGTDRKKISALMVLTLSGGRQTESKIITKMYGTFHLISVVERLKAEKEVRHFLSHKRNRYL